MKKNREVVVHGQAHFAILNGLHQITLKRQKVVEQRELLREAIEDVRTQRDWMANDLYAEMQDIFRILIPDKEWNRYADLVEEYHSEIGWTIFDAFEKGAHPKKYLAFPDKEWVKVVIEQFSERFFLTFTRVKIKKPNQCYYGKIIKKDWIWYNVKPALVPEPKREFM